MIKLIRYIIAYYKVTSKRRFINAAKEHQRRHELAYLDKLLNSLS